jgi:hypothetical protein
MCLRLWLRASDMLEVVAEAVLWRSWGLGLDALKVSGCVSRGWITSSPTRDPIRPLQTASHQPGGCGSGQWAGLKISEEQRLTARSRRSLRYRFYRAVRLRAIGCTLSSADSTRESPNRRFGRD